MKWRFLYTKEKTLKKAITYTGAPIAGLTKFVEIDGNSYADCLSKAMQECKFKEKQLLGSRQLA
jgi:hypothetical protein